jgi:uncharacterized protein YijF (DUF1287 family)
VRRRVASLAALCLLAGWARGTLGAGSGPDTAPAVRPASTVVGKIVAGARAEVRRGVLYDASYVRLPYPGGDVPADRGACTDVVIRALRHAGYDLQKLIHEDMRRAPGRYPRRSPGGLDRSIDHRRTANQIAFLRRQGKALPRSTSGAAAATWQPGDLVYWRLPNGMGHCGVLSDTRGPSGLPLVIHNLGRAREEDCLTAWTITNHFRYPAPPVLVEEAGGR